MRMYYTDEAVTIWHGDCREFDGKADVIVTDPPYGLEFMGKEWDKLWNHHDSDETRSDGRTARKFQTATPQYRAGAEAQEWHRSWCEAMLGKAGWLFAFGGTRTWHRLACAIEDAGWQYRDTIMWLQGQGFPKGKNSLKPAWEPIIVARKYGNLDIDAARIPTIEADAVAMTRCNTERSGRMYAAKPPIGTFARSKATGPMDTTQGRWPANLILDEEAGRMLDEQSGELVGAGNVREANWTQPVMGYGFKPYAKNPNYYGNKGGGASRFFYCAKASRSERNAGLDRTRTVKYNVPIGGALCKDVSTALAESLNKAMSGGTTTNWTTGESGGSITGLCQSDSLSTTLTAISRITTSQILNSLTPSLISAFTQAANCAMASGGSLAESVASSSESRQISMSESLPESARGASLVVSEMLSTISDGANWTAFTNGHPTVKPLKLMEWLIKLSGGQLILDPFMGSGTTLVAAKRLGRKAIGIEIDEHSCEIAAKRCQSILI